MTGGTTMDLKETIERWRFNVELECSGASLSAIEKIAVGGEVLELKSLLPVFDHISALEAQLEEARGIMRDLADDLDAEVKARYQGMEKYPTMFRKAEADREPIRRARAFLTPQKPCPRCGHDTDSKVHQWCKEQSGE